ncbi:ribonuclease III [Pseudodesulfovibrio cashew]|uniref:Ribonuclease 3 n=1 Tax=Pseudodesulfovibrio cashew TaxID=2678688 RepID=A0A6I6JIH4_9BACT|nr:ribonuclease III [Pseudodesulfovibrio cashew]QGY39977.1 ribonuclease III [Pseudodesulfovibrio cashew]
MDTDDLQECIHHRFTQVKLLETALTHSTYAYEHGEEKDNERLEFLGDAVLELSISEEAFARFPNLPEGQLTRIRSRLVREASLAAMARELGLHEHIRLGRGEDMHGGRERDSILSDAMEAVFGAIFLDAGYETARHAILRICEKHWPDEVMEAKAKDYKSRLQEVTQDRNKSLPVYVLSDTHGPDHAKLFDVEVTLPTGELFHGRGTSVKRAEQTAARAALEHLGEE